MSGIRDNVIDEIRSKVDWQFSGITNLGEEAYEDSLRIIVKEILSIPEIAEGLKLYEEKQNANNRSITKG